MPYRKYIIFAWDDYEAIGGLGDLLGDFDTLEEAHEKAKASGYDTYEIVDRDTWESTLPPEPEPEPPDPNFCIMCDNRRSHFSNNGFRLACPECGRMPLDGGEMAEAVVKGWLSDEIQARKYGEEILAGRRCYTFAVDATHPTCIVFLLIY